MLVLNKKRISLIMLSILIAIFSYSYETAKEDLYNYQDQETQITTAAPVSGRVIIIDAGHGTPDEGAESRNGTTEAEINLKIAFKIQKLLEQSGATVILTRSDENSIFDLGKKTIKEKKISDIKNRVKIGNNSSADVFVSIHLNKIPQQQYHGWQCFYKNGNDQSKKLAKSLQKNLNDAIQKENKRVAMRINDIYIVKNVEIPLSIVECGFLSNPEEEHQLQIDEYQERLAWGIYNGIIEYFNE